MPQRQGKSHHLSLTENFVARLKASATVVDYYDTNTSNLCLRVSPPSRAHRQGLKSWRWGYRHGGKSGVLTFGHCPPWTYAIARAQAHKAQVIVDGKQDPRAVLYPALEPLPASAATPAPTDTVREMFRKYERDHLSGQSNNYREMITYLFEKHVIPALGTRGVRTLEKRELVAVYNKVKASGHLVMANRLSSALVSWCRYLVRQGDLEASPAVDMPKTKEQERQRFLSIDEIVLVWKAAVALGGPQGRFVRWLILTLVRRDEASGLPWREISGGNYWLLPKERNKTAAQDHPIPLSSLAQALLGECPHVGP
jgi:hypothetical protein